MGDEQLPPTECDTRADTGPLTDGANAVGRSQDAAELWRGQRVGRYVIVDRIGAGGMGVVLRAYDPDLDRHVALKVLPARLSESRTQHERQYREAQALARLAHENVVAVHDVGMHEGSVFIAMELIDGQTLTSWLREAKRAPREILQVFRAAGRGLSAAHAAGLVHRDFKPTNVMVGRDGRVRVLDFGIARASDAAADAAAGDPDAQRELRSLRWSMPLTQHGVLMGTPLYMAPEQLRNDTATASSDQFAFCVSLWEALCGQRPFAASAREELLESIARGRIAAYPSPPAWLKQVLVRGLQNDPGARFPSMTALLDELGRVPALRRRRLGVLSMALALAAGALLAGFFMHARGEAGRPRCAAAGEAIEHVWNPAQRERLSRAFAGAAGAYGSDTAERVALLFDAYAEHWQASSRATCFAGRERSGRAESMLDRRSACLERRRLGLAALLERFESEPDLDTVGGAVPAAFALPTLAECDDIKALEASPRPPSSPAARREIARVRASLARAEAYDLAGQPGEAFALLEPLTSAVRELEWAPLTLEQARLYARVQAELPEHMNEAQATYEEALTLATKSHDDRAAASLWIELIGALGGNLGQPLEALAQRRAAELTLLRIHAKPDDLRRGQLAHYLAFASWRAGRFDDARSLAQSSLAIRERALGKNHIDVASSLRVLSLALQDAGDLNGAVAAGERALAVRRAALGNDHPNVGVSLDQLAVVRVLQGRIDEAIALHREALAMQERVLGPDHPELGMSLNNLGSLHLDMGQYDAAEPLLARALAIWQRSLAPNDPDFSIVYLNFGLVALGRKDAVRAKEACDHALSLDQAALGEDTPVLAWDYTCLGEAAVLAGTPRVALPLLKRALVLRKDAPPLERADTELALAGALVALRQDLEHALDLSRDARATYAAAGPIAALRLTRSEHMLARLQR